ncbi:hypothetical protein B9Z55_021031 [Caenorhabditis nigoni]|uniref:Uncharacterized protein n=1 Tax=Caenorhabditis nigoni TaxID=1611254 RepID=A0A2G5TQ93_9PELO|nr:hypothetical protein B9Z55_021031 [Caenorhabditis nigoni]
MSDKAIQLKSSKLGCIPIRPFLIVGSILGILYAFSFLTTPYPQIAITYILIALIFAFNACLFYGALKNNDIVLGCCQKLLVFSMFLSFVTFCFVPVLASSYLASNYDKELEFSDATNDNIKILHMDMFGLRTMDKFADFVKKHGGHNPTAGQKFLQGVVLGEMFVVALIVYTSTFYVEYVMIKRLRKFIAARKGMCEHQILA